MTVCPRTKLRMMTPEEAARSFPRLLEEDLLVPLLVTGGSMVPFLRHRRDVVYIRGIRYQSPREGDVILFCRGGGTGPGSSPGPEPVCRRLVSGGRGCPDLDGGGTAGANSRGGDLAQPKWGKGVSGQASGPAGTLGPVVGSAALAAPAAPVGCQSA